MKHLITILVAMGLIGAVSSASAEKLRREQPITGEELVPWPWGSECPFPWNTADGNWRVKGVTGSKYDRHNLLFQTAEDLNIGVKILNIYHYDQSGGLIGRGTGYSDAANKIIKASMMKATTGDNYQIYVRSYANGRARTCARAKKAVAATFCETQDILSGNKCLENQNYLLVK